MPEKVENLTLTGADNVNATGNSGSNILTGNSGNNTLNGGYGNDTLLGGAGDDRLVGYGSFLTNNENDTLTGGVGSDTFVLGEGVPSYYDGFVGFTAEQLKKLMPNAKLEVIQKYLQPLNNAMREFEINTPQRQAAFIAQVAVETGEFGGTLPRKVRATEGMIENISKEKAIRNYGKNENGDDFRGRGLLHLTSRGNYKAVSEGLGLGDQLVKNPNLVAQDPILAARTAGYFWKEYPQLKQSDKPGRLNKLADDGEFLKIALGVNGRNKETGKPNGWKERQAYYGQSKKIINADPGISGDNDYAIISDFTLFEDRIRLGGLRSQYSLKPFEGGTAIVFGKKEVVGVVQGFSQGLSLDSPYFEFG